MAKFKFRNNNLKLEIEDNIYNIDITNFERSEELLKIAQDAIKLGEKGNSTENIEQIILMIEKAIDTLLGKGATKEIFKDRKINLLDLIDLLVFITEEINNFRVDKLEKVYSVNRKDELAD